MMKNWFFNDQDKVIGPLDLANANDYAEANPEAYVWQPTYSQWLPISAVDEFTLKVTPPKPPGDTPKKIIEDKIAQEKALITMLERIDTTIQNTLNALPVIDADLSCNVKTTEQLNDEIEITIENIEQQYLELQKKLATYKNKDAAIVV